MFDDGRRMNAIAEIWRELFTPSDASEGVYQRSLISMGHGLLGGAIAGLLPPVFVVVAYIVGKEVFWDFWYSRGSIRDGIHDSGAVLFGVGISVYYGIGVSIAFALLLAYGLISAVIYKVR